MAKKDDWNVADLEDQELPSDDSDFSGEYEQDGYDNYDDYEDYDNDSRTGEQDGYQEDYRDGGYEDEGYQDYGNPSGRKGSGRKESGGKGRVIGTVLIVAGALCLIVGAGVLIKGRLDARRVQQQMEVLRSQVELDASRQAAEEASRQAAEEAQQGSSEPVGETGPEDGSQTAGGGETEDGKASEEVVRVPNPYADSFQQNSDMAAWLKIEGTKIDYPVMQTMEDENYYLKRGFDKKSNQNGCLILDTDSTVTGDLSTNQIIHGHNMKSGEMFGTLTKYEDKDYCEEHKYIKLYTKECERNYEVIAVFRTQVYRKTDDVFKFYKFFQADTQEEFDDWYDNIKALSMFDTGVTAEFGDRFLTLSTCVYHVENGRLVVVAKEIEPGDFYEQ